MALLLLLATTFGAAPGDPVRPHQDPVTRVTVEVVPPAHRAVVLSWRQTRKKKQVKVDCLESKLKLEKIGSVLTSVTDALMLTGSAEQELKTSRRGHL